MKKSIEKTHKRNTRVVAAKPAAVEPAVPTVADMVALRGEIGNVVCADALRMVRAITAQVDGGHYQAMKYLFEMIGLFPATAMQDSQQEESLAGMLLSRLGIRDEAAAEARQPNHVK